MEDQVSGDKGGKDNPSGGTGGVPGPRILSLSFASAKCKIVQLDLGCTSVEVGVFWLVSGHNSEHLVWYWKHAETHNDTIRDQEKGPAYTKPRRDLRSWKNIRMQNDTATQQQPSLGVERESVTAPIAHDRVWGCVPRTQEEEPDSGVLRTGVPTGSKTEGCLRGTSGEPVSVQPCQGTSVMISSPWSISQGKRQRVGVLVLSSKRGAKARPEQRDENKSTPGSSPRTKQSSQTSRGHQGVMSIKEPTGGTQGTPVTIQECSRLGRDIRSEYPPT
ncbi:hypothetical protein DFH08DRAFT_822807 [Mycena albidolilacea]|uniref:Uncharacterized protein n=1 Tax=Mycena albidolilacea TaxID=1033008 RepID=A0AAD6Z8A9_9AGAR|nr:hypothetical protein DFH08DRAFT_822807 [Mycena albidolilacea]